MSLSKPYVFISQLYGLFHCSKIDLVTNVLLCVRCCESYENLDIFIEYSTGYVHLILWESHKKIEMLKEKV